MATSGTVGQTVFETRKVIDHAARRCKIPPQGLGSEDLDTALDLLFLNLSALASYGIPLWVVEKTILPIYRGERSVPLPVGTVDVMNFNIRQLNRPLGETNSASEGIADNAFDSDLTTSLVQTIAAGFVQTDFGDGNQTQVDHFGIFFTPAATETWDITIQGSQDGMAWTDLYANAALNAVPGDWFWVDLEQQVPWRYFRLQANGTTILNIAEFYLGNTANEIPMPKVSRDSYSNLPDKNFLSRPTEYWFDKQAVGSANNQSIATIWPLPDTQYTFYQYILYVKRQIQDVGTLVQELEIPQRWYEFVICDLARKLVRELPSADVSRIPVLDQDYAIEAKNVWTGEDDGAPVRIQPKIGVYTR